MQNRVLISVFCFLFVLFNSGCPTPGNPYVRINHDKFEIASKSFRPTNGHGPTITLLGAIHVGEKDYYRQIQERLDKASVVLYEAIGSRAEAEEIRRHCPESADKSGGHSLGSALLGLVNQTEHIDYSRPHFVRADMSMTEFLDRIGQAPGRKLCERIKKSESIDIKDKLPKDFDQISYEAKRSAVALLLAKDISHQDTNPDRETQVVIYERNAVAMKVLQAVLPKYGAGDEIVIFYGAGHMPDLEEQITALGYQAESEEWLKAFGL